MLLSKQLLNCCFGSSKMKGKKKKRIFWFLVEKNTWDFLHTFKIPHNPTEHWGMGGRSRAGSVQGKNSGSARSSSAAALVWRCWAWAGQILHLEWELERPPQRKGLSPKLGTALGSGWGAEGPVPAAVGSRSLPGGVGWVLPPELHLGWPWALLGSPVPHLGPPELCWAAVISWDSLSFAGTPCAPSGTPPCPPPALAPPQGLCRIQSPVAAQGRAQKVRPEGTRSATKNRSPEWREFTESYFHDNFNNIPFAKWSWETRNA